MKEKPTHYYCFFGNGTQTKNKLQAEFSEFLRGMEGELYQAANLDVIKRYIIEKAKELNKKHPRCKALEVSFEQYSKENYIHYLCGIEFNAFRIIPAYLIELENDLKRFKMISTRQLKILQGFFVKRFKNREGRLAFLSCLVLRELTSFKELTEDEAFKVLDWMKYNYSKEAYFDSHNAQHLSLLAKCHELGWVQVDNPRIPDLQRLGKFMLSKRCPVQKPLMEMTTKEVSKVIGALEKIIEKRYEKK